MIFYFFFCNFLEGCELGGGLTSGSTRLKKCHEVNSPRVSGAEFGLFQPFSSKPGSAGRLLCSELLYWHRCPTGSLSCGPGVLSSSSICLPVCACISLPPWWICRHGNISSRVVVACRSCKKSLGLRCALQKLTSKTTIKNPKGSFLG